MFTPEQRGALRKEILDEARADPRITGAAITGSASVGKEDEWSDIDLAFGVRGDLDPVLADFTALMERHGLAHFFDVHSGSWIYRVHLMENTLQVDLAFVAAKEFGARADTFKLVFGKTGNATMAEQPGAEELVGLAWLYALHARSSLARQKLWQAEYMVSAMRHQVIALKCQRFGLPIREGRGVDQLDREELAKLETTVATSLEIVELRRAFEATTEALISETNLVGEHLARKLTPVLRALARN